MIVYGRQYEHLKCPFYEKETISYMITPGAVSIRRKVTASLPDRASMHKRRSSSILHRGPRNRFQTCV